MSREHTADIVTCLKAHSSNSFPLLSWTVIFSGMFTNFHCVTGGRSAALPLFRYLTRYSVFTSAQMFSVSEQS